MFHFSLKGYHSFSRMHGYRLESEVFYQKTEEMTKSPHLLNPCSALTTFLLLHHTFSANPPSPPASMSQQALLSSHWTICIISPSFSTHLCLAGLHSPSSSLLSKPERSLPWLTEPWQRWRCADVLYTSTHDLQEVPLPRWAPPRMPSSTCSPFRPSCQQQNEQNALWF